MAAKALWDRFFVATILLGTCAAAAKAAENRLSIGDEIPALTFKDVWYLPRSIGDFGDKQAYVLALVTLDCPQVPEALAELEAMQAKYAERDVQFAALNVGPEDSIREMAAQRLRLEVSMPYVKDMDGLWATALGIDATPSVVVLDSQRRLRYRGRIAGPVQGTEEVRRDLEEALEDVLAGRDVAVAETPVLGTPIPRPEAPSIEGEITFAEHIAPLMQTHCQECHRPGTEAPFSLISYDDVSAYGEMVAEVVVEERMPPWYASTGEFANHRGMSRDERRMVSAWVAAGMPLGDPDKLPEVQPPPVSEGGWLIDEPDLVIKMRTKHKLPAHGFVPYRYVILPHIFQHDTWIQQCEILPSNPRVVHHCNMAYIQPGKNWADAKFVMGKVPGVQPMKLEDNVGFFFPKGSMLILQIHYTTTGQEEECEISVGMRYAREVIQKEFRFLWFVDNKFAIPPGDPAHRLSVTHTLDQDVIAVGLFAHMHVRGRDMSFTATYPDGAVETLLVIPNYNFDWQMAYRWEVGEKILPKGTKIDCVAHYDNSTFNPYNPDPTATVREGQQTVEEMLNGVFFYMNADEELNLHIDPETGRVIDEPGDKVAVQ